MAAEDTIEVFVSADPLLGNDSPDAGGSERPFLTLDYAIREVEKRFAGEAERSIRFNLMPGQYRNEPGSGSLNVFPILPPTSFRAVEFVSLRGLGSVLIQNLDPEVEVFQIRSDRAEAPLRIGFSGLRVVGGRQAFTILGAASKDAQVKIEDCRIEGQATYGLQASSIEGAFLAIEASHSVFRDALEGIYMSSPGVTASTLTVRHCQFLDMRRYSPLKLLGAGIDLYLEPNSELRASIEKCVFRGVASAVQAIEAAESTSRVILEGILRLEFIGNIVNGLPSPSEPESVQVENGFYLSTNSLHLTSMSILNNTFVGIHGQVIHGDNLADQALAGGFTPYRFVNNICANIGGESEFQEEIFARENASLGVIFPVGEAMIHNNLLEKSSLLDRAVLENVAGDPGFVDPAAFDFRLKPDSIAVDGGSFADTHDIATDFAGDCRRMSSVCDPGQKNYKPDLGAYELPGACEQNLAPFIRGDCSGSDGAIEISDAVTAFAYLFIGAEQPRCLDACDSNDDGALNITDGVYILNFLFLGTAAPPAPYPEPGPDAGRDCLPDCK